MRLPYRLVSSSCRLALRIAARCVPAEFRDDWRTEWTGPLWLWMLDAADAGEAEARWAVSKHTRDALRAAAVARFETDLGLEQVRDALGNPKLCLALGALALVSVGVASRGFAITRSLLAGLSYRDPHSVVVLAQGPPVFGIRMGFSTAEANAFREKSKTLAGVAAYSWHTSSVVVDGHKQLLQSANVDPSFFEVLGVRSPVEHLQEDEFLASYKFWRSELHGDPSRVGQMMMVNGKLMRLAGVLPPDFLFLSEPIALWTSEPERIVVGPQRRWWMNLRGVVARLHPGVSTDAASKELREIQVKGNLARRNFQMQATPIEDLTYRALRSYAGDLGILLSALFVWCVVRFVLERRRGAPMKRVARYWGFFALKTGMPLIALVLAVFELTAAHELGVTGGASVRGGPLLAWGYFAFAFVICLWAFRDQPRRCRVCLQRMRQPMRIGVAGQVLLEAAGQEVMCPHGHGSVYTAASVLGSEMSNRWMGFDLEEPAMKDPGRILPRI